MKKGWKILIGVVAFLLVLGIGAAGGAGLTYFLLRDDLPEVYAAPWVSGIKDLDVEGVVVAWVEPGSPAEKAGLVRGDILLQVGNQDVNSFIELRTALREYHPGDEVSLTVLHGDETRTLSVTLDEWDAGAFLGVSACLGPLQGDATFGGVPFDLQKDIVVLSSGGVVVTEVVEGSPAEAAGVEVGDLILSLGGDELDSETSLADLVKGHKPGDQVELKLIHQGEEHTVEAVLGENPEVSGQAYLGVYYQPSNTPVMFGHGDGRHFFSLPFEEFEGQVPVLPHDLPVLPHFENLPDGIENAVIVAEVEEGSPAGEAGIKAGDLIVALDGKPVEDLDSFVKEIASHKPGDEVSLTIVRNLDEIVVKVALVQHPDDSGKAYLGVKIGGFIKVKIETEIPEHFEFDHQKELDLPGGDA